MFKITIILILFNNNYDVLGLWPAGKWFQVCSIVSSVESNKLFVVLN